MDIGDFHGFNFLPPAIQVSVSLRPELGTVPVVLGAAIPLASIGTALQPYAAPDVRRPLIVGHS